MPFWALFRTWPRFVRAKIPGDDIIKPICQPGFPCLIPISMLCLWFSLWLSLVFGDLWFGRWRKLLQKWYFLLYGFFKSLSLLDNSNLVFCYVVPNFPTILLHSLCYENNPFVARRVVIHWKENLNKNDELFYCSYLQY